MAPPPLPPVLDALLAEPNPCVIATLKPDGTPNSVACWYLWADGRILVGMDNTSPRARNIRNYLRAADRPRRGGWLRQVSLSGRVTALQHDTGPRTWTAGAAPPERAVPQR